ncbi:STAS domain-containing protein [Bacillus sp. B15-48]|uniref:STAS domain-containing protein n=1 Tax=Bacillus sp. B15-48 TaxID=1548601 RepID=UPI00194002FB|nr:STAS domain-containing protein [Bacillus sp. B15-48]MBM4763288.1 anti-anti-sigma factor [Bacillus sp. B15-48]
MDWYYNEKLSITKFITENKPLFEKKLLSEAVNVASKIKEILKTGNIDLLVNAQKLVVFVVEQKEEELVNFAIQEGVVWAKHSLTLAFKLEWVQAIRRTLWDFLYHFDQLSGNRSDLNKFYTQEKIINDRIDQFLNNFFLSYSNYKDELIISHRKMVEHLSVPIIPISPTIAVLPLIGTVDSYRIKIIEEKVLTEISELKVSTLIIDLSGIVDMEKDILNHFQKVLTGVTMMGCEAVITGLRPELVRKMVHFGITILNKAETRGTLQQTLKKHLEISPNN